MNTVPPVTISRRTFLTHSAAATAALAGGSQLVGHHAAAADTANVVRIGLIADLHQDVIHDAPQRLDAFLKAMTEVKPDAIVQLGDFAVPAAKNQPLIDTFNKAHSVALHVRGNHDTDGGYSADQVLKSWGMPARYYVKDVGPVRLIVLDANERPANHRGGYPAHLGDEQLQWLEAELEKATGPVIVISHQPLAGPAQVDNAKRVQEILNEAADRVVLALNGHTHIDMVLRPGQIPHAHINSAAYYWVGGQFKHNSYPADVHAKHPYLAFTCPYAESLFTTLSLNTETGAIEVAGCESRWVGPAPTELGVKLSADLANGEHVVPRIRPRRNLAKK